MNLKNKIALYSDWVMAVGLWLLIFLLPSVVNDKLINGTQTGKFFFFSYSVLILAFIFSIRQLFRTHLTFRITIIDILFAAFILWISVNKFILHDIHSFSFRYFELLLLGVFYLIIRNIEVKYYTLFLIAVCVGGIAQAVYGNFQLWGIYPSLHGLFQMTGSFFNPGPFAGYLCGVLPIALGLFWMLNPEQNSSIRTVKLPIIYSLFRLVAIVTIVSISLILPAAQSRAAWLGAIAAISFLAWHRYNLNSTIKTFLNGKNSLTPILKLRTKGRRILLVSAIAVLIITTCFGLYHFKKGSSNGRILIWTVSANIINDYPILGVGQDQFKAYYCDYQAEYFRKNNDSPFESLAVDNQYTFNEFLNIWVENGIVGLLLFAILLFLVFRNGINPKKIQQDVFPEDVTLNSTKTQLPQLQAFQLATIVKAALLSILAFGCFAYPSEILPIKMVVVACLAMLSTVNSHRKQQENSVKSIKNTMWMKISSLLLTLVLIVFVFTQIGKLKIACTSWNKAYFLYSNEHYDDCLKEYEKAWPQLKDNGDFLLNYGKALSMAGNHNKAIDVLKLSKKYSSNSVYYTSLGDSYLALNQNAKAEIAYKNAHYIRPAKFYPEYLLAKLYCKLGDKVQAKLMAQRILQKKIKVQSTAIKEIHQEMQMILNNNNNIRTDTHINVLIIDN